MRIGLLYIRIVGVDPATNRAYYNFAWVAKRLELTRERRDAQTDVLLGELCASDRAALGEVDHRRSCSQPALVRTYFTSVTYLRLCDVRQTSDGACSARSDRPGMGPASCGKPSWRVSMAIRDRPKAVFSETVPLTKRCRVRGRPRTGC
jgi:hypothetical protein